MIINSYSKRQKILCQSDPFLGDLRHPQTVHWSTYKRGAKPFRHPAAFSRPGTGDPDHWICPQIHWLIVILPIRIAQMGVIAHFQTHSYCYIILCDCIAITKHNYNITNENMIRHSFHLHQFPADWTHLRGWNRPRAPVVSRMSRFAG